MSTSLLIFTLAVPGLGSVLNRARANDGHLDDVQLPGNAYPSQGATSSSAQDEGTVECCSISECTKCFMDRVNVHPGCGFTSLWCGCKLVDCDPSPQYKPIVSQTTLTTVVRIGTGTSTEHVTVATDVQSDASACCGEEDPVACLALQVAEHWQAVEKAATCESETLGSGVLLQEE